MMAQDDFAQTGKINSQWLKATILIAVFSSFIFIIYALYQQAYTGQAKHLNRISMKNSAEITAFLKMIKANSVLISSNSRGIELLDDVQKKQRKLKLTALETLLMSAVSVRKT